MPWTKSLSVIVPCAHQPAFCFIQDGMTLLPDPEPGVVAGTMGDNTALYQRLRQLADGIESAAELEGPDTLQVFTLEEDLARPELAGQFVHGAAFDHWREMRYPP